jgi:hypothetical protein
LATHDREFVAAQRPTSSRGAATPMRDTMSVERKLTAQPARHGLQQLVAGVVDPSSR